MPRFEVVGFGRETRRKRVRIYEALNLDDAIAMAAADGTIVEVGKTIRLPDAPPKPATEAQKAYADVLGIRYHPDISLGDLSAMIDSMESSEEDTHGLRPATERQKEYAEILGIEYPRDICVDDLSELIDVAKGKRHDRHGLARNSTGGFLWRIVKLPFVLAGLLLKAICWILVICLVLWLLGLFFG